MVAPTKKRMANKRIFIDCALGSFKSKCGLRVIGDDSSYTTASQAVNGITAWCCLSFVRSKGQGIETLAPTDTRARRTDNSPLPKIGARVPRPHNVWMQLPL